MAAQLLMSKYAGADDPRARPSVITRVSYTRAGFGHFGKTPRMQHYDTRMLEGSIFDVNPTFDPFSQLNVQTPGLGVSICCLLLLSSLACHVKCAEWVLNVCQPLESRNSRQACISVSSSECQKRRSSVACCLSIPSWNIQLPTLQSNSLLFRK